MLQRPSSCEGCPLNETSTPGFCPDNIPLTAKYLVIAEAPGSAEIAAAAPLVGKSGFVFHNWLLQSVLALKLAWERKELGLSNVLRCLPKETNGRPYPSGAEKLIAEVKCRQYDLFPDTVHTIILAGEHSQRLYFSAELEREDATDRSLGRSAKGVMGRIGRVYVNDGRRWSFAPHPAFILRQPMLVSHGVEALKIAVGAVYAEPQTVPWQEAVQELMMQCVEVIA